MAAIATLAVVAATLLAIATAVTARAAALQILGRYVAYRDYLDLEVEGLTGHRVVEVHLYGRLANLLHYTQHAVALGVSHRNLRANEENILGQLAIYHEDILRQIDDSLLDHLAIAILRLQREGNLVARLDRKSVV